MTTFTLYQTANRYFYNPSIDFPIFHLIICLILNIDTSGTLTELLVSVLLIVYNTPSDLFLHLKTRRTLNMNYKINTPMCPTHQTIPDNTRMISTVEISNTSHGRI